LSARPNRLVHEKSPYLLQHAHNPVDWYPWGEEAFERARREHKPVFLSVGYATCHWCHVMAHECFEDAEVATLLNEAFVCVKVDREERPDVDSVYMDACQLTTGSGGWPLTVLLTPDRQPFFAGTYFPKHSRAQHVGMLELVPRLRALWNERLDDVLRSAKQLTQALQQTAQTPRSALDASTLQAARDALVARFDPTYGGFGTGPKFPTPHQLTFLLRAWRRRGDARALAIVEKTLSEMRRGGIWDHVGFGFHRYATDAAWRVPHFEKMLYDQALLALAYTEAFCATHKATYRRTAEEILDYVLRELTSPEGAFYSAEDADSPGGEGAFYTWSEDEVRDALSSAQADLVVQAFNVTAEGNFFEEASGRKMGTNILYQTRSQAELAAQFGLSEAACRARLEAARRKLFAARAKRPRPPRDDKVLCDWNGLMLVALAKAAQAFGEPRYARAARRALSFLRAKLQRPRGRLWHRYRGGEAAIPAYLNDYAFLTWGVLELYETTFELGLLHLALELNGVVLEAFWDERSGGFYQASDNAQQLPLRKKEVEDGALPSGNSVAMLNLLRLSHITTDADLEHKAWRLARSFSAHVRRSPAVYTQLLQAVDFGLGPCYEVVVASKRGTRDAREMLGALGAQFVPNKVLLLHSEAQDLASVAPFVEACVPLGGQAVAYVCEDHCCHVPTSSIEYLLASLGV